MKATIWPGLDDPWQLLMVLFEMLVAVEVEAVVVVAFLVATHVLFVLLLRALGIVTKARSNNLCSSKKQTLLQ